MVGAWVDITGQAADKPCRDRFAAIMQLMDPRYRSLTGDQLATWTDPSGPYKNDVVQLFGWFPAGADKKQPGRMQLALACQYDRAAIRAHWMMFGWAAPNFGNGVDESSSLTRDEVLSVLAEVTGKLIAWMKSLNPVDPTAGIVTAVRPHSMKATFMHKLYEQGYFNAITDRPIGGYSVSIHRQRTAIDSTFLQLKLASLTP